MTDFSIYELNKKEFAYMIIALIIISISLSYIFYDNVFCSLSIIIFIPKIKKYFEQYLCNRRKDKILEEFKDFLFIVSTSSMVGKSMLEAIEVSIEKLKEIYGSKTILADELKMLSLRIKNGGESDEKVLMDLGRLSDLQDIMDFATLYSICKETGASLIIAINNVSKTIIEKMTIEKSIKELVKRKESEGLVILIMPLIIIIFLKLISPEYISPLYNNFIGNMLMTIVITVNALVYKMVKRITGIKV